MANDTYRYEMVADDDIICEVTIERKPLVVEPIHVIDLDNIFETRVLFRGVLESKGGEGFEKDYHYTESFTNAGTIIIRRTNAKWRNDKMPSVTIVDDEKMIVEAEVQYQPNEIIIKFTNQQSGIIILN